MQVAPGWYPDPSQRYPLRAFDGQTWTGWVSDGAATWHDPAQQAPSQHASPAADAAPSLTNQPIVETVRDPPSDAVRYAPLGAHATLPGAPDPATIDPVCAQRSIRITTPQRHQLAVLACTSVGATTAADTGGAPDASTWSVRDGDDNERASMALRTLGAAVTAVLHATDGDEIGRIELSPPGRPGPVARLLSPWGQVAVVERAPGGVWGDGRLGLIIVAGSGGEPSAADGSPSPPPPERLAQLALTDDGATTWLARRLPDPLHTLCALTAAVVLLAQG